MRKTVLSLLAVLALFMCAACRVTQEEFCPTGGGAVVEDASGLLEASPAATPSVTAAEEALVESIGLELYRNGESHEFLLTEDADKRVAEAAVFNYLVKSAAWPGVDVDTLDLYIRVTQHYQDGTVSEYYVYDKDGAHCMQAGRSGMYSTISGEVYRPLYELAMGWRTPHTMTVVAGGERIHAVRNWIWTDGSDGLSADGFRMTPQEAAPMVEYITHAQDFAPYVDGEMQPGAVFKLYNEDFEEVKYPIPSGLAAWTSIGRTGPGRYIAVTELDFEEEDGSRSGYQYFFGVIVPEESA